jgi:hypothetical protein
MKHPLGPIPVLSAFDFRRRRAAAMINPRVGVAREMDEEELSLKE